MICISLIIRKFFVQCDSCLSTINRLLSLIKSPKIGEIAICIVFNVDSSHKHNEKKKKKMIFENYDRSSPYKDDCNHLFMHLYHVSFSFIIVVIVLFFFFFFTNFALTCLNCSLSLLSW